MLFKCSLCLCHVVSCPCCIFLKGHSSTSPQCSSPLSLLLTCQPAHSCAITTVQTQILCLIQTFSKNLIGWLSSEWRSQNPWTSLAKSYKTGDQAGTNEKEDIVHMTTEPNSKKDDPKLFNLQFNFLTMIKLPTSIYPVCWLALFYVSACCWFNST